MEKQGELDEHPRLTAFAQTRDKAALDTIKQGTMTKDLAALAAIETHNIVNSAGFLYAVRANLEKML